MIEYTVMDYEGEPVIIENGEMLDVYADSGEHWNAQTCEFEPDEEEDSYSYADEDDSWYRNSNSWNSWNYPRRRESNFEEQSRYFYADLM